MTQFLFPPWSRPQKVTQFSFSHCFRPQKMTQISFPYSFRPQIISQVSFPCCFVSQRMTVFIPVMLWMTKIEVIFTSRQNEAVVTVMSFRAQRMTQLLFPGCFRSQRMTLSLHATSLASPLLLVLLLHVCFTSTVVAEENDILRPPPDVTCECCYARLTSQCCLDCAADLLPEGASELAPYGFRFPRDDAGSYLGALEAAASRLWAESHGSSETPLPGCFCCMRELLQPKRLGLMFIACCSVCAESKHIAEVNGNAPTRDFPTLTLDLPALPSDDVIGDAEKGVMAARTQKRMTSMDCMCCMNSGISDCCSRCRIF